MIRTHIRRALPLIAVGAAVAIAGCGGSSGSGSPSGSAGPGASPPASATKQILPVADNPITNSSTAPGLRITKVLVENNVSADTGKAVDDHLEVALKNSTSKPLDGLSVYYKITDPKTKDTEGYFTKLEKFTVPSGSTRVAHFDNTGATDHYPTNKFSLYYTDKNALVVDVTASSPNVKPATFTVKKDSGGAEAGVE